MDSKNKNFDDIRRLSQSIEIKNKILKKYLDYFNKEEIDFINDSIKYRDKFDNEIMNQNPNLELYFNGFNSINNTLNGFIEYLKESNIHISENNMKKSELKQLIREEVELVLKNKPSNYMFFENLKTIKSAVDAMLQMNPAMVDQILSNGHDWANDHITTSKDDVEEVYNFLKNHNSQLDEKALSPKQKKIASAAPPEDKITGADFAALRKNK